MKIFYSFKLKQNGNGLLLIHVVHEIETMHSSWFFTLVVPVLKWSTSIAYYLLKLFNFESVFVQKLNKGFDVPLFSTWPVVSFSEANCARWVCRASEVGFSSITKPSVCSACDAHTGSKWFCNPTPVVPKIILRLTNLRCLNRRMKASSFWRWKLSNYFFTSNSSTSADGLYKHVSFCNWHKIKKSSKCLKMDDDMRNTTPQKWRCNVYLCRQDQSYTDVTCVPWLVQVPIIIHLLSFIIKYRVPRRYCRFGFRAPQQSEVSQ